LPIEMKALPNAVERPSVSRPALLPDSAGSRSSDIHTLWIGGELGPLEWLCLHSWLRLGYRVILHAYESISLPPGVERFDAARLLPAEKLFKHRRTGSWATFADIYRALILRNFTATWLDADIFLVRPLDLSGSNILAKEHGNCLTHINNAVMKLAPDHPILDEILDRYDQPLKALPWNRPGKVWHVIVSAARSGRLHPGHLPWGELGGRAIQSFISRHGFDGRILGPELCLTPFHTAIFQPSDDPDGALAEPVSYVHLYRSQLQADPANPLTGSVYSRLWDIVGRDVLAQPGGTRAARP
jgi:hypothetical protein